MTTSRRSFFRSGRHPCLPRDDVLSMGTSRQDRQECLSHRYLLPLALLLVAAQALAQERLPLHVTPQVQKAVAKGLDWLAKAQGQDGNYPGSADGTRYPVGMTSLAGMAFLANGNTPSRGPYAENVHRAILYVMDQAQQQSGLIASSAEYNSMSMH